MGKKSKVCSETDLIKGNFAIGPPLQLEGEGGAPSLVLGNAATPDEPFVHLVVASGPYRKKELKVTAPGCTIGSSERNDLVLTQDRTVSSLHARLQFFGNEWWLIDCDSANGTYLLVEDAGRPIEMGDMFRIARCEVQLFAVPTHGAPPVGTAP